jgi:hypothetical protein
MLASVFIELVLTRPIGREDSVIPAIITIAIIQLVEVAHLIWSSQVSWADLNLILLSFSLSSLISPHLQMKNPIENLPKSFPPHYSSSSLAVICTRLFSRSKWSS